MIDAFHVAGDLGICRDRVVEVGETGTARGVEQTCSPASPPTASRRRSRPIQRQEVYAPHRSRC
jgi:hypothetical protein